MKKKLKSRSSSKENKTGSPAASQLWRDRLNKTKLTTKSNSAPGESTRTNLRPQFQNATPGNTSRKAKKGFRAG